MTNPSSDAPGSVSRCAQLMSGSIAQFLRNSPLFVISMVALYFSPVGFVLIYAIAVFGAFLVVLLAFVFVRSASFQATSGPQPSIRVPHTEDVELYHWEESLCSAKVRAYLIEKGIKFKSHIVRLSETGFMDNLEPSFLNINPNGTVPVLVHRGIPVLDSTAIMQYVEKELGGSQLIPTDPTKRQMMEYWNSYGSMNGKPDTMEKHIGLVSGFLSTPMINSLSTRCSFLILFKALFVHPEPVRVLASLWMKLARVHMVPEKLMKKAVGMIRKAVVEMEHHLTDTAGPFLCGDQITLADITWMANFDRWASLGYEGSVLDPSKFPRCAEYWDILKTRHSYKAGFEACRLEFVRQKFRELRHEEFSKETLTLSSS